MARKPGKKQNENPAGYSPCCCCCDDNKIITAKIQGRNRKKIRYGAPGKVNDEN